MKRSEAIKAIYDTMKDNHFGQYCEFYKMAESVLDRLEDEGMLPPFGSEIRQQDILDKWDVSTGKTKMVRVIKPMWDKEDEEK